MSNKNCPICRGPTIVSQHNYESDVLAYNSQEKITVPNVKIYQCKSEKCGNSFLPHNEDERIKEYIRRYSRYTLNSEDIAIIRNALGCSTKAAAARFLNLNEKAFIKWEKNYCEINSAYDLLLRLAVFDRRNIDFINHLHATNFSFVKTDYQLICDNLDLEWKFNSIQKPILSHDAINNLYLTLSESNLLGAEGSVELGKIQSDIVLDNTEKQEVA